MELGMSIVKIEISIPEALKSITKFKENRVRAFEEFTSEVKHSVANAINQLLHAEMTVFLGEEDKPDNKRNGYKDKDYALKGIGTVRLKIPQDRRSRFESAIIKKNEVIDPRLKEDMAVLHLAGISTRTMAMISKRLLGVEVSPDTVTASLDLVEDRALGWLQRPIDKKYWALYIDGTNFKIQRRGATAAEPSLVVLGIDENNHRSVLAIEPGFKDNVSAWEAVFNSLIERGLDMASVKLGIMDGLPGLENTFKKVFNNATTQRCWVHCLRNAMSRVPKALQIPFKELTGKIMYAASKKDAINALANLKAAMGSDGRRAVYTIEKDIDSLTAYFDFDKALWTALKTTNPIERINRELKRRTKSMGTLGEKTLEIVVAFVALRIESSWQKNSVGAPHFNKLVNMKENSVETTIAQMFSKTERSLELC